MTPSTNNNPTHSDTTPKNKEEILIIAREPNPLAGHAMPAISRAVDASTPTDKSVPSISSPGVTSHDGSSPVLKSTLLPSANAEPAPPPSRTDAAPQASAAGDWQSATQTIKAWALQRLLIPDVIHLIKDCQSLKANEDGKGLSVGKIANILGDIWTIAAGAGGAAGVGWATTAIVMAAAPHTIPAAAAIGVGVITGVVLCETFANSFGRLGHFQISRLFPSGWEKSSFRVQEKEKQQAIREQKEHGRKRKRAADETEENDEDNSRQTPSNGGVSAATHTKAAPPPPPSGAGVLGSHGFGADSMGAKSMGSGPEDAAGMPQRG